jgi:hypothetical protein
VEASVQASVEPSESEGRRPYALRLRRRRRGVARASDLE